MGLEKDYQKHFTDLEQGFGKRVDLDKDYWYRYAKSDQDHLIEAVDPKTGDTVFKATYDRIGTFDTYSGIWRWGWAHAHIDKELQQESLKVKQIAEEIENNYESIDRKEADLYHYYSSNGYFYVSKNDVPSIIEMALSKMDAEWFIAIRTGIDDEPSAKEKKLTTVEYLSVKKLVQIGS